MNSGRPTEMPAARFRLIAKVFLSMRAVLDAFLLVYSLMLFLMWMWTASPPPVAEQASAIVGMRPVRDGDVMRLGKSWFGEREGIRVLYLAGSHFEMGYASGALTEDLCRIQEESLLDLVRERIPYSWARFLILFYVTYRNRDLPSWVPRCYQEEILGMTLGGSDPHPEVGPFFHRVMNYHAAHDISHMLIDNPLVIQGCTSFGAWGEATEGGRLIAGRNFDWEAGDAFDSGRVVIMCEPDGGIPFISLAWAGTTGCVSGVNRAGVSVAINGTRVRSVPGIGTPVSIVVREVLERARNLREAVEIIRGARVFVSDIFLVGSREDGRFIAVEKTPERTAVREGTGGILVCSNHFLSDELRDIPDNVSFRAEGTSESRFRRMKELLESRRGHIAARDAVEILRDRRLPGGRFAGNGHRGTLDAWIATHAFVLDLSEGIFWAASPPHLAGKFVAFDVNDFSRRLPDRAFAPDPAIESGELERYRRSLSVLAAAEAALKAGDAVRALSLAVEADKLNPCFYRNAWMRGRALLALGRNVEAAESFREALDGEPAFAAEREELRLLAARAEETGRR
jgi:isopenicillin-N N-acyltransferase-like protein